MLPSAPMSPSVADRGTTALLSSVAGGTTENEHLTGGSEGCVAAGPGHRDERARAEPGRGGSGTAGSSVEAVDRRSFSCAVNEIMNEVGARSEEGCGLDWYEITPFL